jgi:outer membrane protein TolC
MNAPKTAAAALLALLLSGPSARADETPTAAAAALAEPATAPSQEALSLQAAQDEALEHSPYYLKAKLQNEEMSWQKLDAASGFLPRLSLEGSHFSAVKFQDLSFSLDPGSPSILFPEIYPYSEFGLQASWSIFEGFAGLNRLAAASRSQEAAQLKEDWALLSLKQELRLKYFQALAAKMLADLAQENVKTLENHRQEVQDLLDNGQGTQYDVLRVEVQLQDAETEKLAADDQVILARRKLSQVMGEGEDPRPLQGELPVPDPALVPESLAQDLGAKPDLVARQLEAEAAAKRENAAASHWLPKVSLIGAYQYYNNSSADLTDEADYQTDYQVGAAASWDLFDGGGSVARQKAAEKQALEAVQDLAAARQQASYDFDFWKRRYRYSCTLYQARLSNVDKSRESVRLATLGEKAGTRTSTEVLDAELDYFRATAGAVSAQMDAVEALINLELALGKGDLK